MARGTVKWFNESKGYGFITAEDAEVSEVFVHHSAIEAQGFRTLHPGVLVRVHEPEDTADIVRQVAAGRAELGLTDITVGGGTLVRVPLGRQEVLAVCPPGTPGDGPITPGELLEMPIVATPPGTSTRRLLDVLVERTGRTPRLAVEIGQREAIMPLVLAGAGCALLPASMALEAAARGAVVRSLRPALTRRIGLLHRRGPLSPAAVAMIALATGTPGAPDSVAQRKPKKTPPSTTRAIP